MLHLAALTAALVATEPPPIDRFLKIRAPRSPSLAPDGTLYAIDWPDGIYQLYRRGPGSEATSPMTQLTSFEDGISSYQLSPDGSLAILSASAGGSEQDDLHLFDSATGEVTTLMSDGGVVFDFGVWLPDGSGFVYAANDESPSDFHLYHYDLASRESRKILAEPGYWFVTDVTMNADRLLVGRYFSAAHAEAFELDPASRQLTPITVAAATSYTVAHAYMPGEDSVLVVSDANEGQRRLYSLDLTTGSSQSPLPEIDDYDVEEVTTNERTDLLAVRFNEGGYGSLRIVSLPGFDPIDVDLGEQGVVSNVELRDTVLTWTLSNARNPGLGFSVDLADGAPARRLTVADDQGIDLSSFTLPQLISFESFDGLDVPAFLYTPPGHRPGSPIPFVVIYHGGPESQSRPRFSRLSQYLLTRGFGVMLPNVRGSTGYGRAYHQLDNYRNRWDSVRDGVEAARWLVKNGYSKNGHIAAYGGSYGGFMAVATVIEDQEVFGASVDVVGIVNFRTFLEKTKSYRRKLREAEYGPLSDPEFLESVSPINRIDDINVPMLIGHGLNDPRVPINEAMQLATGLQRRGLDPEILFFEDEGHGLAKLENRLLFYNRVAKFLEKHIALD